MKTLIIYLSATGNTKRVAQEISNQIVDSDLLAIELKTKIPSSEFWKILKIGFFNWLGYGMKYSAPDVDISAYDQVIIGTPVWMGKAALPIINYVNELHVDNMVKGLFATCGVDAGIVFSDLCAKTGIGSISNCLSISKESLDNGSYIQRDMVDFVNTIIH